MKTFTIPVWEQVKQWNDCIITVKAESAEAIMDSIKAGSFMTDFEWEDITLVEMNLETQETIDWDYSSVELSDIEEVL